MDSLSLSAKASRALAEEVAHFAEENRYLNLDAFKTFSRLLHHHSRLPRGTCRERLRGHFHSLAGRQASGQVDFWILASKIPS